MKRGLLSAVFLFLVMFGGPGVRAAQATPIISLTGTIIGPPFQAQFTIQDVVSGIQSIQVFQSTNAATIVPPFAVGITLPLVITATVIDQTQLAFVGLTAINPIGQSLSRTWQLDPVAHTVTEVTPPSVPEPATVTLVGTGIVAAYRRLARRPRT